MQFDVNHAINTIVPFIALGKLDYYNIVIFVAISIIPYVLSNYDLCWLYGGEEIQYTVWEKHLTGWYATNDVYNYLEWYLLKQQHGVIKSFYCYGFERTTKIAHTTNIWQGYPLEGVENTSFHIKFRCRKITIKKALITDKYCEKDKKINSYTLTSNSLATIKLFLENCQSEYISAMKKEKDFKKIYRMVANKDNDSSWIESGINVNKTFDNVFIGTEKIEFIRGTLDSFLDPETKGKWTVYGKPHKISFMFSGPPGTGKTSTVFAVANYLKVPVYSIDINLSVVALRSALFTLPEESVILLDDIDCCTDLHIRKDPSNNKSSIVGLLPDQDYPPPKLRMMLEFLDGYTSLRNSIVVINTNHPELLDPALIRPGRIDHHIEFGNIDLETKKSMCSFYGIDYPNNIDREETSSAFIQRIL